MNQRTFYKTLFFFSIIVISSNKLFGMESSELSPEVRSNIAKHNAALENAQHECDEIGRDVEALSTSLENIQIFAILDGVVGELSLVYPHHSGMLSAVQAQVEEKCGASGWFQCQVCAQKLKPKILFPLISTDISRLSHQNRLICNKCSFCQRVPWTAHRATPLCPAVRPIVKKLQLFHASAQISETPTESPGSIFCDYCASKIYGENPSKPDHVRLSCGHIFHKECFAPFAQKCCPHCHARMIVK